MLFFLAFRKLSRRQLLLRFLLHLFRLLFLRSFSSLLYWLSLHFWLPLCPLLLSLLLFSFFARAFLFFSLGMLPSSGVSPFTTAMTIIVASVPSVTLSIVATDVHPILILSRWEVATHLNNGFAAEHVFVAALLHEVDGIDAKWQHNLEASGMVVLDLEEGELWKCSSDIILSGLEVALDEVERNMSNAVVKLLDGLDDFAAVQELLLTGLVTTLILVVSLH